MVRPRLPLGGYGEITLYQQANGRWQARARFRDSDGKTRQVKRNGRTKAEATQNLREHLAVREYTANSSRLSAESTLKQLHAIWWEDFKAKGRSGNTEFNYNYVAERHLLPDLGDVKIRECTVGTMSTYLKRVMKSHGYRTGKILKTVLSGMFATATTHDVAPRNIMRDVVLPPQPKKKETVALSPEQAQQLRGCLSGEVRRVYDVLLGTGARIGEVLALRWQDIDFSDPDQVTISIQGTASKDSNGHVAYKPGRKRGGGILIPAPGFTVEALLEQKLAIPPHATSTAWATPESFIFPSSTGTIQDPNNFRGKWREQLKGTEFAGVSPHAIRSTVASYLEQSADLRTASRQLGHSNMTITAQHYVKARELVGDNRLALEAFAGPKE